MGRTDISRRQLKPTHCRYCSRTLSLHEQYAGGLCSDPACRRRELEAHLIAYREQAAGALDEPAAETFPIVVIPHREGRVVPMEAERRQDFEVHLRGITERVAEASRLGSVDAASSAGRDHCDPSAGGDLTAAAAVCGVCRGFCCYHGGHHSAFIDEETIAKFAADHPALGCDDIVAEYLRYVPEQHFEGSCVYHTRAGCSLPRSKRAEICNAYECRGLRDAAAVDSKGGRRRLFVVARQDNRIVRGAFVDGTEQRAFPPPASPPAARDHST